MSDKRKPMPPDVKEVRLIRVVVPEGEGVEKDPMRLVTYWYEPDGHLVARADELDEEL